MYRNVMEMLVEAKVNNLWKKHDGCTCEQCREDVIAFALNHLPPKYVVSSAGELFVKVSQLQKDNNLEITRQVAFAMKAISESPHHKK